MAEKCLDQRMQNKKSSKHKLGNGRNSWSKEQADARHPISKKQLKQQQQQRQRQNPLKKTTKYLTYEFREDPDSSVCRYSRTILNRICMTASKIRKRNFEEWPSLSFMLSRICKIWPVHIVVL